MAYDNTNKGAIWREQNKTSERAPDYKGSINIDGVEYWLSGWGRPKGSAANTPAVKFSAEKKESK